MRLAVLASLNGTNARAIVEAARRGVLDAEVAVIVTNRAEAGVITRCADLGVPVEVIPSKGVAVREEYDRIVVDRLAFYGVDTVALAGWMRILSDVFIDAFPGRIVNLHPALLPSFTGGTGIADAWQYGVKLAGCSVHLVSPVLDGGPLIIQAAVPVSGSVDELEARIHRMEHLIFSQALQWLAEGRLTTDGRRTSLLPASRPVKQTSIVDGCLICPPLESPLPQA